MKYKKTMILLVLAIFIFGVASVCASDVNETTIATQEDNQMELTLTEDEIQTNENDNMLTQTEDAEILTSGEGSYSDLRNDINSGGNLTKSHYRYNDGDGGTIEIKTSGVINGNGAVIDMAESNIRAFTVSVSGVTIKNLTIINANYGDVGGAIYFDRTGTVTNCNFTDNTAIGYGGAVYFNGKGDVTKCNFVDNQATGDYACGGAVYFVDSGSVSNCNFTGNTATYYGGAVYFYQGTGEVTNCNFTYNTAKMGKAIYINNKCTISDCDFTNNPITKGAIHSVTGDITLSNNIINVDDVVSDKNFTEIQKLIDQANDGDEITINGLYAGFGIPIRITKSLTLNGQNNTTLDAKKLSKTLYITANNVIIKNIQFTSGYADHGGAIYFSSTGTVTNCNFTNNTANEDGGAVYFYQGTGEVTNCNFTNNKATGDYSYGGAVCFNREGTVTNCNFTGNNATVEGGAVYFSGTGTVSNCNFTDNSARNGGAVWIYSGTVSNCNFTDNIATSQGGAVFATSDGGAVYFENSGNVTNCNFTDNSADYGGAIRYLNGEGNVKNCNFVSNTAFRWGGAIRFNVDSTVTNCNFTGNTASRDGGAINMGGGTVSNCNFINNTATENGGAVRMTSGNVSNCNFTDNSAGYGGAIYFDYSSINAVTKCNFIGNNATEGSAIYFYSASSKTVSNSRFLNNRANAEELQVTKNENNITIIFKGHNNLLNAIYSRNDAEVTFINVTYWGAKGINNTGSSEIKPSRSKNESGQNITVGIVVNGILVLNEVKVTDENGMIVLPIKIESENYYIGARHDKDSYYTEAEKTISNNMKFSVNVTSQTANNRTVNITAKSDIYGNFMPGKLLFIVPNTNPINATYAGNGTWWAVYTFADYGEYEVNATFEGLENVTVNNATISISKIPTNITVNTVSLELFVGDETVIVATLTPGDVGNVTFTSSDEDLVLVEDNGNVIANGEGHAIITVSFAGNDKYAAANKTINVTVKLNNANVTVDKDTLDLKVGETYTINATKTPDTILLDITYTSSNTSVASVDKNGVVTAVGEGTAIITVSVGDDEIYALNSTNVTVRVSKVPTEITALDVSAVYNADNYLIVYLKDSTGKALTGVKVSVDLNGVKEYTTDSNGQVKVSTKGLAPKTYAVKIAFNGNAKYDKSVKEVKVTVKKATPKIIAKKKTYKAKSAKKFKITLKDNTGKPIKNAKVRLIVKKIAKKAKKSKAKTKTKKKKNILKTNKKGKATFKVKRNKKGKYIATVKFYGNKYFKAVTKKVKIIIK